MDTILAIKNQGTKSRFSPGSALDLPRIGGLIAPPVRVLRTVRQQGADNALYVIEGQFDTLPLAPTTQIGFQRRVLTHNQSYS
nr:hypothetical protein [Sphingopyxis indica]